MNTPSNQRILLIDDMPSIHEDFRKILSAARMEQHRSLPIIALTASTMARDRQECLNAGMNDLLAKPIDPKEMLDMLLKWIPPLMAAKRSVSALQPLALAL